VKLPSWFTIDTPIGSYNPDWAFVTESEEKLYFVRETKGTLDSEERRSGRTPAYSEAIELTPAPGERWMSIAVKS
jgi:restriction endonuclease